MAQVDEDLTAGGQSTSFFTAYAGDSFTYAIAGTFAGTWELRSTSDGGYSSSVIYVGTAAASGSYPVLKRQYSGATQFYVTCTAYTSGTIEVLLGEVETVIKTFEDAAGNIIVSITDNGVTIEGDLEVTGAQALTGDIVVDDITADSVTASDGDFDAVDISFELAVGAGGINSTGDITSSGVIGGLAVDGYINNLPGQNAINQLRVASDVVSAETVTIGADVYEVEIVNTDTTDDTAAGNSFNNTTDPLTLATFTTSYPNATIAVGGLLRIENEIVRCTISGGGSRTFKRGCSGTTTAAHANGSDIFGGNGIAGGSTIAVGLVTTLTPTAFTAALVGDINTLQAYGGATEAVSAVVVSANEVLLYSDVVGVVTLSCTETLGGANNAWTSATMYGGKAQGKIVVQKRVPLTQEVTLGNMHFYFAFAPTVLFILVSPTATPGLITLWDGAVTVSGNRLTINNAGLVDWAATDTVVVGVSGV